MLKKNGTNIRYSFNRLGSLQRVFICLLIAALFYFVVPLNMLGFTRILFCWNVFSLCLIILSWITFITTAPEQMRDMAMLQDENRTTIFFIILVSTAASMFAVLMLLTSNDAIKLNKEVTEAVALTGMALSWFLVHTTFTLRYAHLYYGDDISKPPQHATGLNFPEEDKPDYIDFAYFAFVLGMTFQVSDVEVTSRRIRRLTLLHGILSFGFNTIIVALTINVIAGLRK